MFETNIQNNSALISLARAAELTGYHQDYLGQLCRLGRLPAKKVGRNWFTSHEALKQMAPGVVEDGAEEEPVEQSNTPELAQAITISKVEGLPIVLRTMPRPVQINNTVQSIVTNLRIESLQKEVAHLRSLLNRLMEEVTRHTNLLEGRVPQEVKSIQDSLRHSYISNFDFNPAQDREENSTVELPKIFAEPPRMRQPEFTIVTWLAGTAVLAGLAFMGLSMATGNFFGITPDSTTKSVYYKPVQERSWAVVEPSVAGANSEPTQQVLPTVDPSGNSVNMVQ